MGGRIKRDNGERLKLPIIGKIKCGCKSEKGYPMSLDYFIASGKYAPLFEAEMGKPNRIQIVFPSDNPDLVCREEYTFRDDAGKLVATGDGETFKVWSSKEQSYKVLNTDDYPDLMNMIASKYPRCKWYVSLTLNFIIPRVRGVVGLWQFQTKGEASSIPSIRDAFDSLMEINGSVSGVIFDLSVEIAKSNKPGVSSKYPVVRLVVNESEENKAIVQKSWVKPQNLLE